MRLLMTGKGNDISDGTTYSIPQRMELAVATRADVVINKMAESYKATPAGRIPYIST